MITLATLSAIAAKHGLATPDELPIPWTGATSRVYPLDDVVVKVSFDDPASIHAVRTDAAVAPVARHLGVRAPELLAFDDSGDIVRAPYAIFQRIAHATTLDRLDGDRRTGSAAWESVGRQLALVHRVVDPEAVPATLRTFRQSPDVDPRPWVETLLANGTMREADARWLLDLLNRLAPLALDEAPVVLCHGDVNAANVLAGERTGQFRALIDWAGAGWLDPVWDFAGVPLDAVPALLAGHRSVAPLPSDGSAEARICWCQAQTRLYSTRNVTGADDARAQVERHIERLRRYARATGLM